MKKPKSLPLFQRILLYSAAALITASCTSEPPKDSYTDSVRNNSPSERDAIVQRNMADVQLAAEHFSADHGLDKFPGSLDENFMSYFPGGTENQTAAPNGLANPYNGSLEFPIFVEAGSNTGSLNLAPVKTPFDVRALRSSKRFKIQAGIIVFFALEGNKGYAIVGGAHDNYALMDKQNDGEILVLSNID